jgi:hypothetical protein
MRQERFSAALRLLSGGGPKLINVAYGSPASAVEAFEIYERHDSGLAGDERCSELVPSSSCGEIVSGSTHGTE